MKVQNLSEYIHTFEHDGLTFEIELCHGWIDGYKITFAGKTLPEKATEILCESEHYWKVIQDEVEKLLQEGVFND